MNVKSQPEDDRALGEAGAFVDWPYSAHPPQRYTANRHRYIERGGLVNLEEDVKGFVGGGRNTGDMARYYSFCLIIDQLTKEGLPGDLAEVGVYKGDTATLLANAARRTGKSLYLLDTFEGFCQNDIRGIDANIKMEFSDTSLEAVKSLVGTENVAYVKGYFPATAKELPGDAEFCLVHIDCDLYAPMMSSLQYFYPRIVAGGYLLMHDYTSLHWRGAEAAVDEFFADKPESVVSLPDGAGTAITRKIKSGSRFDNWMTRNLPNVVDGSWISVSHPAFSKLLLAGWSQLESWGVWGVGSRHELRFILPQEEPCRLIIEADVSAVLIGERRDQVVEVFGNGEPIGMWEFTMYNNQGVRSLEIDTARPVSEGLPFYKLEFRPRHVTAPSELDVSANDTRELGLALYGARFTMQL